MTSSTTPLTPPIADACVIDGCQDPYRRCVAPDATATAIAAHGLLVMAFRYQVRGDRLMMLALVEEAHDTLAAFVGAPSATDLTISQVLRTADRAAKVGLVGRPGARPARRLPAGASTHPTLTAETADAQR